MARKRYIRQHGRSGKSLSKIMKDTLKFFVSAIFWNAIGLGLVLFALAILFLSILFENTEVAAWLP